MMDAGGYLIDNYSSSAQENPGSISTNGGFGISVEWLGAAAGVLLGEVLYTTGMIVDGMSNAGQDLSWQDKPNFNGVYAC